LGCGVDLITNISSITKTRYVHESSNTLLLRVDDGDDKVSRISDLKLKSINFLKYNMIVISDYNKGFLYEDDIAYIAFNHPNVICDTKKQLGEWCNDLKFIKLNRSEYENNKEFISKNDFILEKLIITLDRDGCMYKGKVYPTKQVEILDISGAGDTFVSAFTQNYIENYDINTALKYANECASVVVQKRGVTTI
jgi:bifunctional ADP-heptose synthase (sugar kinase/adenylyltransferase)